VIEDYDLIDVAALDVMAAMPGGSDDMRVGGVGPMVEVANVDPVTIRGADIWVDQDGAPECRPWRLSSRA
jgi:hypothetical protein